MVCNFLLTDNSVIVQITCSPQLNTSLMQFLKKLFRDLLFLIYIIDLPNITNMSKFIYFCLYCRSRLSSVIFSIANSLAKTLHVGFLETTEKPTLLTLMPCHLEHALPTISIKYLNYIPSRKYNILVAALMLA